MRREESPGSTVTQAVINSGCVQGTGKNFTVYNTKLLSYI